MWLQREEGSSPTRCRLRIVAYFCLHNLHSFEHLHKSNKMHKFQIKPLRQLLFTCFLVFLFMYLNLQNL